MRGALKRPKAEAREIAIEKLRRVGLKPDVADKLPAELSGGMQKRVGLARGIAAEPEMIFFDEPTTGLDPIMAGVINELIREIVDASRIVAAGVDLQFVHGAERLAAVADSHLALCASGTATIETALLGTPMIVLYRLKALSYWLARWLVDLPHFCIVNLVLISVLFTMLFVPLLFWLQKKGMKGWMALMTVLLLFVVAGIGLLLLLGITAVEMAKNVDANKEQISQQISQVQQQLESRGIDAQTITSAAETVGKQVLEFAASAASNFSSLIVNGAFVLLIVGYMLAEASSFVERMQRSVDQESNITQIVCPSEERGTF